MSTDAQKHAPTDSSRLGRIDPAPVDRHPLRKAPERLARVSAESDSVRRMMWARVNQEIARLGGMNERTVPNPILGGRSPVARRYARKVRPRPDL